MTGATQTLLERADETQALADALARARAGDGGTVLVEGEAGIGKTRLLSEARTLAEHSGMRVLAARGAELEAEFAFGTLRALLAPALRAHEGEALFAGPAAPAAVALGFDDASGPDVQASSGLLDALYWLVDAICAARPLALIVDDFQWVDTASQRALAFIANRAEALPLAILVGLRTGGAPFDALRRVSRTLTPAPLSPAGVAALAVGEGDTALADDAIAVLHLATHGNPFLVTQVAADVARYGPGVLGGGEAITATAVRGVVWGRLLATPPAAQEVARAVAVLGDGAHLREVAAMAGLGDEAVLAAAGALSSAGIFEDGAALAFAHPLLAEAVLADATAHDRSLANLRAARLLRRLDAGHERVAGHLARSAPTGDAVAVRELVAAARDAMHRGVPESAASYLERALAEPPADAERSAVERELGLAELACGRFGMAAERLEPVLDDAGAPAVDAASAAWARMAPGGHVAVAEALVRAAAARPDPDDAMWLRGMARVVSFFVPVAQRPPLEAPLPAGADTRGERMAIAAHLAGTLGPGSPATAPAVAGLATRALGSGALCAEAGANGGLYASGPLMALLYAEALDTAEREIAIVEDIARRQASTEARAVAHFPRTYLTLLRGDAGTAAAQASTALDLAAGLPGAAREAHDGFVIAILLVALLASEGTAAAEGLLAARGVDGEVAPAQLWVVPARALVRLAAGRAPEALSDARAFAAGLAMLGDPLVPAEFLAAEPLALAATGETAAAIARAEAVLARERAFAAPGRVAGALRTLATVAPDRSAELLDEALALAERAPLPLERARVRIARGIALRRRKARAAARDELQQGVQLATACHATALAAVGLGELHVLGARPRRLAFDGVDSLTRSERRVVDLAATGLTSREIAQELFVTVKTVNSHLERSYRKLGINSRAALADALQGKSQGVPPDAGPPTGRR